MINNVSPTLLVSQLMDMMLPLPKELEFSYVINVSSEDGQFSKCGQSFYHPHINISKAALNMLTRTASSLYAQNGILMNSVDSGVVSSFFPKFKKSILSDKESASRILHPIFTNCQKYGKLFKDFQEVNW
jgi:NAD(P)-dependent dehydrogenase (short-subunit alcohol dehydrogenase family)